MEKSDVVNLIKYHYSKNDDEFYDQAFKIAREFEDSGDIGIAKMIDSFMKSRYMFVTQNFESNSLNLVSTKMKNPLYFPTELSDDLNGIVRSILSLNGICKYLFVGQPGTGKTESVKYIANKTNRKLYSINMTSLIDSGLGQTLKNIQELFAKIVNTFDCDRSIFLFDELDLIAMDRINQTDVREMGRATSLFLKCLDSLPNNCILFATTNLGNSIDKALKRRFDYIVNFDVYSKENIAEYGLEILKEYKKESFKTSEISIIKKLLIHSVKQLSPADLRNLFRISIAFSNENNEFEYLKRVFAKLYSSDLLFDMNFLHDEIGLSSREIELLTGIPKSSVCRKIMEARQ